MGLLVQLVYNTEDELVEGFADMMKGWKMPTTLPEIGIASTKENFDLLFHAMAKSSFVRDEALFEKSLQVIF